MKRPEWLTDSLLQKAIENNEFVLSGGYNDCNHFICNLLPKEQVAEFETCLHYAGITKDGLFAAKVLTDYYYRTNRLVHHAEMNAKRRRIAWCRAMIGSDRIIRANELPEFAILEQITGQSCKL